AIGGQGFFMLRASGSAEADMYTRAGEFRFDKEGYLVNPTGNFVQGWTLDTTSGERQGTIGDINLGKTTPPVQTTSVQVIANVDSRKNNETAELNLFDAWNGTNPALPVPTSPISSNAYEYTTAIKVYDSVGASHDLTVYFDRTTKDNQWEFLVTCEPSEDQRRLGTGLDATGAVDGSNDEASIYTPDATYNYKNHKGAGALMYGKIDFSTSGAINNMSAWKVPPDGAVDPAQNTNRLFLGNTDQYYSFETNFTGAVTNQQIALNLGARYSGQSTAMSQILVSGSGGYTDAGLTPITKETQWSAVKDSTGANVTFGAVISWTGYRNNGAAVSGSYTIPALGAGKVQDLLDAMNANDTAPFDGFNCTCTIDAAGRIVMTDNSGGPSGMAVTTFGFSAGVNPFGASTNDGTAAARNTFNVTTSKRQVVSTGRAVTSAAGSTPITAATLLTSVYDSASSPLVGGDTLTFVGKRGDGTNVNSIFTVGTSYGPPFTTGGGANGTVQHLLSWLENAFDAEASIDGAGRLVLTDRQADVVGATPSALMVDSCTASGGDIPFGTAANDYTI
ncbi:MAG: flagellar hook-basal body complex protein, partial [Holophaga sp.]|nr:flagellar hook-basal body complex protein [Holophaga sp.]